jgi:hypothetical protein
VLAQMLPLEEGEAEDLYRRSLHSVSRDGLDPAEFPVLVCRRADVAVDLGRDWLREQQPDLDVAVVISWDQSTALRTTWEVFTSYWNAFCYPASDDVLIFSDFMSWVLFYFHEEEF